MFFHANLSFLFPYPAKICFILIERVYYSHNMINPKRSLLTCKWQELTIVAKQRAENFYSLLSENERLRAHCRRVRMI